MNRIPLVLLLLCCVRPGWAGAQQVVLRLPAGTTLQLGQASLHTGSDIVNNGTITGADAAVLILGGNNPQTFSGTGTTVLGTLRLNNAAGASLQQTVRLSTGFGFTQGKLSLDNADCILNPGAAITGARPDSYFVTNGSGQLVQTAGSGQTLLYPVGTAANYAPFSFANQGTADVYSINVLPAIYPAYNSVTGTGTGSPYTNLAVAKTWVVNEGTPGGANFNLDLQWNAAEELPGFVRNAAQVRYFNYANGGTWVTGPNYAAASGNGPYSLTRNISGIAHLNQFLLGVFSAGATLPLQLQLFTARAADRDVLVQWTTLYEANLSQFTVEKSVDGRQFLPIGKVPARNSNGSQEYRFEDRDALFTAGEKQIPFLYYRLRIDEQNGRQYHSAVERITTNKSNGFSQLVLSPNPATTTAVLSFHHPRAEAVHLILFDAEGRPAGTWTRQAAAGYNQWQLPLQNLAQGQYRLQLRASDQVRVLSLQKI